MRKILLLLISGLLIACMAGSAMAHSGGGVPPTGGGGSGSGTTVITDEDLIQTENSEDAIVVPKNSQTSIALDFSDIMIPKWEGAEVKISLSGSGFEVILPKGGSSNSIFYYLNDNVLSCGESVSKKIYSSSQKTYNLEVVDKGTAGTATLTVTLEKDGNRCTCS